MGGARPLGLVVAGVLIVWKGEKHFERAASRLVVHYGLPTAVHGAVVVAVGSSVPAVSAIVISTVGHGEFSLGLATPVFVSFTAVDSN